MRVGSAGASGSLPNLARQSFRSLPTLILALSAALLLSYELWRSYAAAREDAERNVSNLIHVMSEQVARTIQSVDVNLQDIAGELAAAPAMPDNDPAFRARLHKRLVSMPFVRALFVIDRGGYISHDTDFPSTPRVSLADRDYFRIHQNDPSVGMHIGRPLKSRSRGVWFISLSRGIETADGSFGGIVVAAVEPLYFQSFYQQLWVGGGTVSLFLSPGTLLARSPARDELIGTSFAGVEPFRSLLAMRTSGVDWRKSPIDGVMRIAGYQRLDIAPVIVVVTLSEADVMRSWRSHATVLLVGAAILFTLLAGLEWLSRRSRRREEAARQRLETTQRLEAIGRFAGSIAHDCGNLMRIIRSATVVLRPLVRDRQEAEKLLDEVDTSLDAGRALVNRLLAYARNTEIRLEAADPGELVREILPIARQAAGPGIAVATTSAGEAAACRIDRAQFQAAIVNLVLNARDAMPAGGTITIDVRSVEDMDLSGATSWVDVSVTDDGIGMSEAVRRQAFDPFFTMKGTGEGHGMGLSQTQEFVRQCGGRADIFSQPGEGTTVRLRLPQDRGGEEEMNGAEKVEADV